VFPDDGVDAEQLLAHADHRMYFAKRAHYEQAVPTAEARSAAGA
jgi:predicted signal transduction protein with EAL and GGDEF domain